MSALFWASSHIVITKRWCWRIVQPEFGLQSKKISIDKFTRAEIPLRALPWVGFGSENIPPEYFLCSGWQRGATPLIAFICPDTALPWWDKQKVKASLGIQLNLFIRRWSNPQRGASVRDVRALLFDRKPYRAHLKNALGNGVQGEPLAPFLSPISLWRGKEIGIKAKLI